jgi:hypothetical protein
MPQPQPFRAALDRLAAAGHLTHATDKTGVTTIRPSGDSGFKRFSLSATAADALDEIVLRILAAPPAS